MSSNTHTNASKAHNLGYSEDQPSKLEELHSSSPHVDTVPHGTPTTFNEQYENTPLWIRGNIDDGYFITLGNQRISEFTETKTEAIRLIKEKDWNLLFNIVTAIGTKLMQLTEEEIDLLTNNKEIRTT